MKKILYIAICVMLAGCSPQKRLSRLMEKYPLPQTTETIIRDSVHVEYHDRIVYDTIEADTVYKEKAITKVVRTGLFKSDTAILENDYATAKAWVDNAKLHVYLLQKERVIQRIIRDAEKRETYWRDKYVNTRTTPPPVKYVPKIVKFAAWGFVALVVLGAVVIYFQVKMKILSKLLKRT